MPKLSAAVRLAPWCMVYMGRCNREPCDSSPAFFFARPIPHRTSTPIARAPNELPSLTDNQLALLGEVVLGNLEVQRGRTFPDAARDVVVGTVAGAEPPAVVAGLADGHATQVRADACDSACQQPSPVSRARNALVSGSRTKHDEPLGLLNAVAVALRMS